MERQRNRADQLELESAMRCALFHDRIRREITMALRWSLDTLKTYQEIMPKSATLAFEFHRAEEALKNSERLTETGDQNGT
jgi:hypothetical protein